MHELPVIKSILDICLRQAVQYKVSKIVGIHLEIGRLSDLEEEWMQKYFDYLSEGTVAEGAKIKVEWVPIVLRCTECGESFEVAAKELSGVACPKCHIENKFSLVSGKEYQIKNMEAY